MRLRRTILKAALSVVGGHGVAATPWDECKTTVLDIQSGKLRIGDINNENIHEYLYHGPVAGLRPSFPRENYLAVTYRGEYM